MFRFALLALFSAFLFGAPAHATDLQPGSYCPNPPAVTDTLIWTVDSDLNTEMEFASLNSAMVLSDAEMVNAIDQGIQNLIRQSRTQIRWRVNHVVAQCDPDDTDTTPCIVAERNVNNTFCNTPDPETQLKPLAYANRTTSKGHVLVFCTDNLNDGEGGPGFSLDWGGWFSWQSLAQHELGHLMGLGHVAELPELLSACSTSDGCEGEMMCGDGFPGYSAQIAIGDGKGLRKASWGSEAFSERQSAYGMRPQGGTTITRTLFGTEPAIWTPRVDCGVSGTNQCAIVSARLISGANNIRVSALRGWTLETWATPTPIVTFAYDTHFQPDITLNADGTQAWIVLTSLTNQYVHVKHINMTTGVVTTLPGGLYRTALPPRVDFNQDLNAAIVVGAEITGAPSGGDGLAPKWTAHKLVLSGGAVVATQLNFGVIDDSPAEGNTRLIASNFDFDCRLSTSATDDCALVAVLHDDADVGDNIGDIVSRSFTVAANGTVTMPGAWISSSAQAAQSIEGVTITSAGKLVISEGTRSTVTSALNSRTLEYSNFTVALANETTNFTHTSDTNTCAAGVFNGVTMGASTPAGGTPLAWCPTCGTGRVVSIHSGVNTPAGSRGVNFCY